MYRPLIALMLLIGLLSGCAAPAPEADSSSQQGESSSSSVIEKSSSEAESSASSEEASSSANSAPIQQATGIVQILSDPDSAAYQTPDRGQRPAKGRCV